MASHICNCFYSSTGVCVFCGASEPAKAFRAKPEPDRLPAPDSLGSLSKDPTRPAKGRGAVPDRWDHNGHPIRTSEAAPVVYRHFYTPRSSWGREQIRRSYRDVHGVTSKSEEELELLVKALEALKEETNAAKSVG